MTTAVDVLIVGAGPAGSIAGLVLARAGARVRLVDRATFPRDKLCGDTINPGTLADLHRLGVGDEIDARGLRIDGMIVTGDGGQVVEGLYPSGRHGRALLRRDLDAILLRHAVAAGCEFEEAVVVREAHVVERSNAPAVDGVVAVTHGSGSSLLPARVVIAADGRRSTLGFSLGLARHPPHPRRWAIGAYFEGVLDGVRHGVRHQAGEMHVRRNCYIGVAQVPGGLTNVCLVRPARAREGEFRDPRAVLHQALTHDGLLRDRIASARLVAPPVVLGPLAVDVTAPSFDGLLMAGDAAGFIDPMTGDGLRFAIRGGELAAHAALRALEHGWTGVQADLASARAREFAAKWRFNRALRSLVSSSRAIGAAAIGARIAPGILRAVIARAGDCDLAA